MAIPGARTPLGQVYVTATAPAASDPRIAGFTLKANGAICIQNPETFNPLSLFSLGEPGGWYDPNDLTTLFQDDAGTIPVTAPGQVVGRMLDKSGHGLHMIQATEANKPTYGVDALGHGYLQTDGVDDVMNTLANMDFTTTNKATFCVGAYKQSDAVVGSILELSVAANANLRTFGMITPNSVNTPSAAVRSSGSVGFPSAISQPNYPAPMAQVLTGLTDISIPQSIIRINGAQAGVNNANQGTGNYGSFPLYILRRGTGANPFNGRFYGAIVRGAASTPQQVADMEAWMSIRVGVP